MSKDYKAITDLLADWITEYMGNGLQSLKVILWDNEGDSSEVKDFAQSLATVIVNRARPIYEKTEVDKLAELIMIVQQSHSDAPTQAEEK